jgi:cold shock CspA family protein
LFVTAVRRVLMASNRVVQPRAHPLLPLVGEEERQMSDRKIWLRDEQPGRNEGPPRRGKMLWFNEEKNRGVIVADDGEQLSVLRSGFVGTAPEGTVGGIAVEFRIEDDAEGRRAEAVRILPEVSPRRARRRRG